MSRSYKGVFLKKHRVYAVEDLMRLYSVTANTVSNWVREGLTASDYRKPYLFQGAVVISFHKQRRERDKINLRPGEFKCMGCKAAVFPAIETVRDFRPKSNNLMYFAQCPDCHACISKFPNETDRDNVEICRNPSTTTNHLHELIVGVSGCIGISDEKVTEKLWFCNDRIVYKWLNYANRYDVKTIDRHLAAIRYCEKILDGKSFNQFTTKDVSKVRNELKRRAHADVDDHLSPSTIKHIVSHLTAFFNWLLKQDGFKRLPKDLPDYLKLPKAALSSALIRRTKEYPSIAVAVDMLQSMPTRSRIEQRAQAIFALAFLGALRADTLISLRIGHIDVRNQRIIQDASMVRAKNGKSDIIFWFPIPEIFR